MLTKGLNLLKKSFFSTVGISHLNRDSVSRPPDNAKMFKGRELVNRDDHKMRGNSGKKIARKSRNSCKANGRGCGCIGTVDSRRNLAQS